MNAKKKTKASLRVPPKPPSGGQEINVREYARLAWEHSKDSEEATNLLVGWARSNRALYLALTEIRLLDICRELIRREASFLRREKSPGMGAVIQSAKTVTFPAPSVAEGELQSDSSVFNRERMEAAYRAKSRLDSFILPLGEQGRQLRLRYATKADVATAKLEYLRNIKGCQKHYNFLDLVDKKLPNSDVMVGAVLTEEQVEKLWTKAEESVSHE